MVSEIKEFYGCPICHRYQKTVKEARDCRDSHQIIVTTWAVGENGEMVFIDKNARPGSQGSMEAAVKRLEGRDNDKT